MSNKIAKFVKNIGTTATLFLFGVSSAFATNLDGITGGPSGDLLSWVKKVLNLVIGLTGLIAVGYLIYSGIQYIMAAGDDGKVEKATKGITYAVIGLVVCFISVLVVNFVLERVIGA